MKLDDVLPFVAPHALGRAQPVLDHEIRLAAQEFFRRTHAWQQDLDALTVVDGQLDYDLSVADGLEIVKVLQCTPDDSDSDYAKVVDLVDGAVLRFQTDDLPPAGKVLQVKVAIAPEVGSLLKAWTWPDHLMAYADDIANGALSKLLIKSDREQAELRARLFAARVSTVGLKVSRGFSRRRAQRSSAAQFF
jgi:hypothetical protein